MDTLTALPLVAEARAPLPAETPLAMPEQDLRRFDRSSARRLQSGVRVNLLRLCLFAASVALTAWLASEMHGVLAVGDLVLIEAVLLGLFVINIGWISFTSVSTVLGLFAPRAPASSGTAPIEARTAILLPAYNEDTPSVVGVACATLRALQERGVGDRFDLFI
ncbi:MAG: glucan biosynthesis glucosyltransferase H, partial [Rhodobacteraceae bacterium]|nr:glucan biosynthesis glucosyltransferase H [Paracoccaceae bacterium]